MGNILPSHTGSSKFFRRLGGAFFLLLSLTLISWNSLAGNFPVTNTNNAGPGSLRQAILDMNAAGEGPHTIVFNVYGVINISTSLPAIAVSDVTIDGADRVTINAGHTASAFFIVNGGLSDITIRNFTLLNTRLDGVQIAAGTSNVTIEDIVINTTGTAADRINAFIRIQGASDHLTIRNISSSYGLENLAGIHGRGFYFSAGHHTNLLVENIDIDGRDEAGTYINNMFAQFAGTASLDTAPARKTR